MLGRILYILQRLFLASWAGHKPQHLPHRTHPPPLLTCHAKTCFFFKYQTILLLIHPSNMENPHMRPARLHLTTLCLALHSEATEMVKKITARSNHFELNILARPVRETVGRQKQLLLCGSFGSIGSIPNKIRDQVLCYCRNQVDLNAKRYEMPSIDQAQ